MQVLLANLKHFYQHRGLWLAYVCLAGLIFMNAFLLAVLGETDQEARENLLVVLPFTAFLFGSIAGGHQIAVALHPFALCLPGHPTAARRCVFLMGFLAAFVASVLFVQCIEQADVSPARYGLVLGSALCAHLIAYLIGAGIAFSLSVRAQRGFSPATVVLLLICLLGFAFVSPALLVHFRRTLPADLERTIVHSPLLVIALGAMTGAISWLWIGRPLHSRRVITRREPAVGCQTPVAAACSNFFLSRMRNSDYTSAAKHIWAMLYAWLLPGGGGRREMTMAVLFGVQFAILSWYMPFVGPTFITLASISQTLSAYDLPVHSNLLFTAGRRQRFTATMLFLIILGSALMLSIVPVFVVMERLGPYTPWAQMRGDIVEWYDRPMGPWSAALLTAIFPIGSLLVLVFRGKWLRLLAGEMALYVSAIWLAVFERSWIATIPLAHVIVVLLLSWSICAFGVYRVTMRRDLTMAKPAKGYLASWSLQGRDARP